MYNLQSQDLYAEEITDAYENYENECEIKVLVELTPDIIVKKYKIDENIISFDATLYMLVTLNKKYKNISYLSTEYQLGNGEVIMLPSNYSFEEKEIIKKIALQKMREEFFKNY
jgi:hypothetical protein